MKRFFIVILNIKFRDLQKTKLRNCLKFEMAHKNQKFTPTLKGDF